MNKIITLTYYGMEGTGPTLKEAKADASRKLEAAVSGSYNPEILEWRGYAILLYREPDGWHSKYIASPQEGIYTNLSGWSSADSTDKNEARTRVRFRLAQSGWSHDDPDDELPEPIRSEDRRIAAEFRDWRNFQRRYRRAKVAGCDDMECHAYGCQGPYGDIDWAQLVARVEGSKTEAA